MVSEQSQKVIEIDISRVIASWEALRQVPAAHAKRFGILPIAWHGDHLQVVLCEQDNNLIGITQIEARTGLAVEVLPCSDQGAIRKAIERYYPRASQNEGTPLAMFEEIVNRALQIRSSDIHLDPEDERACVRMRVDGLLRLDRELALEELAEMVSAIKVAAGLDIAERRAPQDGQITIESLGEEISMRVATIPTVNGEKVTLRILATAAVSEELADVSGLGMSPAHYRMYLEALANSHGVILLSGPTGSGKTTTLYAALRHLSKPGTHHILSIEDPVEIPLGGINQIHVDSERVSFNKALRSTLRHDPDIIMIGEIRDAETADVAVKSALTGHLVLSTLHANDSVGVVTRLLNLGVSPELVTSSLRLVIAQRLVRRPCPHCMEWKSPEETDIEEFRWQTIENPKVPVVHGCSLCGQTGYAGRVGLYEMIKVDRGMRELISSGANHDEILNKAFQQRDMLTLAKDGAEKILQGVTTMEEVRRVTYLGEDS